MRSIPALNASSFVGFFIGFRLSRGVTILDLAFITNSAYAHCSITFTVCFLPHGQSPLAHSGAQKVMTDIN